jgi:cytochrome c oxidase assembly protein subunit 15
MQTVELYNFSPVLVLMLTGLVLAMGPLAWIWFRHPNASSAQRLRVLTLVTLFITFDLVIFGAFTRLTDSGLGCPDWPGCYGSASPLGAQVHIDAAQSAMPTGPVTHPKAWIEMIHRYLATAVGVLILSLAVGTWFARRRKSALSSTLSPWWPAATLIWVCLQGAFGALTVTMKLFPAIVTMHLLGGLVLLALLRSQSVAYAQRTGPANLRPRTLSTNLWWWALASFVVLWMQIALGGWVSTNYAVLACTDFPTCQQSLWPAMNFSEGFTLWRSLGGGEGGGNISFQALTAIHYTHRLAAYFVFVLLLGLSIKLHRLPAFRQDARWLAGLIILQAATGLSNVVLGWPLIAAVAHTGGAAALVVVMTGIIFSTRPRTAERPVAHASKSGVSRLTA